jgi:SNF2 family DNA or RNA helicase
MTVVIDVFDDTRILIHSDQPFRDKELISNLPGASYDLKEHRWLAPLSWASCRALRGIFDDRLEVGEKLTQWSWDEYTRRIKPAMELRQAWDAEGAADLYPFQRAGVLFLAYARRALLCDEMGTGKTIQAIRTLAELTVKGENVFPAIVVAPNNMLITWRKEFEKWWPGIKVNVVKGSANKRREILKDPAHVYVINWEGVRTHSRLSGYGSIKLKRCLTCDPTLPDVPANSPSRCEWCKKELNKIPWRTVIADEVHRMKDPNAKQTRAVWSLRTKATEFVYGLSGTAVANAPHDLWAGLHLISKEEWPVKSKYVGRYCLTSFNPYGPMRVIGLKEETKQEFFDIVDPRMRRMPKEAVLPFLPKKTYQERYVEMSQKQKRAYDQMEDGLVAQLDSGLMVAANPLVQLTRLTQFASAYAELNEQGETKLQMPSNKVDALVEILEELDEDPVVVFAQSKQLIDLASHKLTALDVQHGLIVGGQTPDEREWQKTEFMEGRTRAILCTIAAGGVGITLTRAGTAVFLQRSWSMVDNSQAEDRVHRIGAEIHDKVNIIDILSSDTLEERQRVVLDGKLDRLEEVMRDRDTLMRVLGAKA